MSISNKTIYKKIQLTIHHIQSDKWFQLKGFLSTRKTDKIFTDICSLSWYYFQVLYLQEKKIIKMIILCIEIVAPVI